ncbi:hypothetical protein LG198_00540 [Methylobacillus arboreus]|uniref:hypothetical protein n=1 Tax=Methylobacillus arboreus TaxID=755170 RepID=UPI001E3B1090|nr:hypothetical protein [Methylobacillus arboreus]MCB5189220.1 hypothetical protein [Methylobacillus arboreus]
MNVSNNMSLTSPCFNVFQGKDSYFPIFFLLFLLFVMLGMATYGGPLILLLSFLFIFALSLVTVFYSTSNITKLDLSGYLLFPLFISAFQNIYLGLLANDMDAFALQMFLMLHWMFAVITLTGLMVTGVSKSGSKLPIILFAMLVLMIGYSVVLLAFMGGSPIGLFGSFRNLSTPWIFFLLGFLSIRVVKFDTLLKMISFLGYFIIFFGFLEYFLDKQVWLYLNIEMLWAKKGLRNIAEWGLPLNFVSSERIFGEQVRRMASSYADPVNFGTVLFLIASIGWYTKRYLLLILSIVCMVLAISKGAFLGLLVLFVVWSYFYTNRVIFAIAGMGAAAVGVAFLIYSSLHSTQSVAAHSQGLWSALMTLPSYPLGRGLGNVGILSGEGGDIKESGLGIIIGQLGVFGILLYGFFFSVLIKMSLSIPTVRDKVFATTLAVSILINIAFNEVALSPNSSAGYFMILGLILAATEYEKISNKINKTEVVHG